MLFRSEMAFRDAIACYEKAFDYPHRDVVNTLVNLARVYADDRKFGLAEATYLRAVKLEKEVDASYPGNRLNSLTWAPPTTRRG
mgnify:CR=1 FL=1